jgi:hypothetical protein
MKSNPDSTRENQRCNPLAPALAPGKPECVHAGGDLEPLLAPFGGCNKQVLLRACTPSTCTPSEGEKPVRILLSESASKHLDQTGENAFAVIAFDRSDQHSARWVMHLVPCSFAEADDAVHVAQGFAIDRRKGKPKRDVPLS